MTETHSTIEVLDLRHFSARQLRPLLEQEAAVWEQLLGWDYRNSIELLLQYLDSRILPGFVASMRGKVCGLAFCVYEGHKAVIGDLYVARGLTAGPAITEVLLRHLLEVLEASPQVDRIESQLLLFPTGSLTNPFGTLGFTFYPRLYQQCNLGGREAEFRGKLEALTGSERLSAPLEMRRWNGSYYEATAELIHASYNGHIDAGINDQYKTLHGSMRFLHNIVRFPGCGTFEANASWVLRDPKTNVPAAVVLCSKIAAGMAHVTQLCVTPAWRGHKLGQMLMLHCMANLTAEGYRSMTLTVTESNESAVKLYRELGFFTRHRFDAMVREKSSSARHTPVAQGDGVEVTEGPPTFSAASIRTI